MDNGHQELLLKLWSALTRGAWRKNKNDDTSSSLFNEYWKFLKFYFSSLLSIVLSRAEWMTSRDHFERWTVTRDYFLSNLHWLADKEEINSSLDELWKWVFWDRIWDQNFGLEKSARLVKTRSIFKNSFSCFCSDVKSWDTALRPVRYHTASVTREQCELVNQITYFTLYSLPTKPIGYKHLTNLR